MKKLFCIILLIFPSLVFGSDGKVYYCSEIKSVGFVPKENYKQYNMKEQRYKVWIDFEKKIIDSSDLLLDKYNRTTKCIEMIIGEEMFCSSNFGATFSINKNNLKFSYTKSMSIDPMYISHGECEVF